jgi:hypothetical protein
MTTGYPAEPISRLARAQFEVVDQQGILLYDLETDE